MESKDDATQEEVDRAKEELQDALDSLVEKEKPVEPEAADKTELGASVFFLSSFNALFNAAAAASTSSCVAFLSLHTANAFYIHRNL